MCVVLNAVGVAFELWGHEGVDEDDDSAAEMKDWCGCSLTNQKMTLDSSLCFRVGVWSGSAWLCSAQIPAKMNDPCWAPTLWYFCTHIHTDWYYMFPSWIITILLRVLTVKQITFDTVNKNDLSFPGCGIKVTVALLTTLNCGMFVTECQLKSLFFPVPIIFMLNLFIQVNT